MSWAKLDDKFHSHPKCLAAGLEAIGLYAICISYAADHLTDGFVPDEWIEMRVPSSRGVTDSRNLVAALVDNNLAEKCQGGVQIVDYLLYNPSRADVIERRAKRAESGKRGGQKKAANRAESLANDLASASSVSSKPLASASPGLDPCSYPRPVPVPNVLETSSSTKTALSVQEIFDGWVAATDRDAARTKLTPDRRRCITAALKSHGRDDCLAAVKNIGADSWARGHNDRGNRFDDIQHALKGASRIERWRDATPRLAAVPDDGLPRDGQGEVDWDAVADQLRAEGR